MSDILATFLMTVCGSFTGFALAFYVVVRAVARKLLKDIDDDKRCPICHQEVLDR